MRKILGITMGDPAGVGPEITVKALQDPKVYESCKPLVVGDAAILERACGFVGAKCTIHPVADPSEGLYEHGIIDILDLGLLRPEDIAIGQVSAAAGDAAFRYVRKVIELAMDGKVDATVTNPLNKEAMNLAGHHFSGHTEIYAHYTGTEHYTMMLAHKDLRVVHVSTHVSLREACDRVKKDRVLEVISIADKACRDMGIAKPRIGVAGLNPHCGEGGLFGRESTRSLRPSKRPVPQVSTRRAPFRRTRSSRRQSVAGMTSSWQCTMTKATSRSRSSALSMTGKNSRGAQWKG